MKGQHTYSVTILAFLSLPDPPALWNANLSAGAGEAQQQHFLGAPFMLRGISFLLQPSLLAVANIEQEGVQEEMFPVWLLGIRCAQKAGAGTAAMQKYSVVQTPQTALARGESLCILGFLQRAATLGRKRGVAVFSKHLNCLPCTLPLWMSFHENSDSY